MKITWCREDWLLLADKAVLRIKDNSLFIADLHFGRGAHLRKAGIPVSRKNYLEDLNRLITLLSIHQSKQVFFLGDLFHSSNNQECEHFGSFLKANPKIGFHLIVGNHDIIDAELMRSWNMKVSHQLDLGGFQLVHDPSERKTEKPIMAGHLHPGVKLSGKAKQSLRVACFWVNQQQMVLPAFSSLSGLFIVPVKKGDQIYTVAESEVFKLSQH